MPINVLAPGVYNLLSAGEVVENPSAIVKEVVENSIDAGATKIEITLVRGGLDKISVVDNGCGVAANEVEKVFYPHATSKIACAADLENIGTLGFRGEAMASIAAVSSTTFSTNDGNGGVTITVEGGKPRPKKSVAINRGTSVVVENLFFNTPARAKFLRSPSQEKNAVTSVVARMILANPGLAWRYEIDGEKVYDYRGKTLLGAIKAVYADAQDENLIKIDRTSNDFRIFGFIGTPDWTKKNRTYQNVIVNGRAVEGGIIADAVNSVFSNFVISGNFPFFTLAFDTNFKDVDVNIHPRKAQVKFSAPAEVTAFVQAAVAAAIDGWLSTRYETRTEIADTAARINFAQPEIGAFSNDKMEINKPVKMGENIMNLFDLRENPVKPNVSQQSMDVKSAEKLKIFGTVFNSYILVEIKEKFMIIDQHAAHERILYDKLAAAIKARAVEKQRLLETHVMMLSPDDMVKMDAAMETLNACGIECERFGSNCYKITAVPVMVAAEGMNALTESLLAGIGRITLAEILKDKIISICCKAAIKAGDRLPDSEIRALATRILDGNFQLTCPHGRPIVKSFTLNELEKLFARK